MESTAFFEKKISLTPTDLNKVKKTTIDDILISKAKDLLEKKCSEHGYVLPGSIKLLSRSMGRFEDGNKTGDSINYLKLEGKVIYPADGLRVIGEVIRKNKMGLYVEYKKAMRIQVPRDLHIGSEEYEEVQVGDLVEVELKRSKFQINDLYILSSGIFITRTSSGIQTISEDDSTQIKNQEELAEAEESLAKEEGDEETAEQEAEMSGGDDDNYDDDNDNNEDDEDETEEDEEEQ
jgi:hypothetical protein